MAAFWGDKKDSVRFPRCPLFVAVPWTQSRKKRGRSFLSKTTRPDRLCFSWPTVERFWATSTAQALGSNPAVR